MKTCLADYLGRWEFTQGTSDKYYRLLPVVGSETQFVVEWGKIKRVTSHYHTGGLNKVFYMHGNKQIDAVEALRRICTKERGGYKLDEPFSGKIPAIAFDTKTGRRINPAPSTNPPTSKKRTGFSFVDWMENSSTNN